MLQGGEAPRLVRSNTLFSLLRPATQAASGRLAGRSMGLLLRLAAYNNAADAADAHSRSLATHARPHEGSERRRGRLLNKLYGA